MALRRLRDRVRDRIARELARRASVPGVYPLAMLVAQPIGGADPRSALVRLATTVGAANAVRVVLDPTQVEAAVLAPLLTIDDADARWYAERAALRIARADPFAAKTTVLQELLGGRRLAALSLVPEIAPALNLGEATLALASSLRDGLRPIDPYEPEATAASSRAVASVLAAFPSLFDNVLSAAGTSPLARGIAADLLIMAFGRGGLVRETALAQVGSLVAASPDPMSLESA